MASTRLVRKELRNRTVSKKRISSIKRLTAKPVIKNVDIEQIKEEFANNKAKPAAKKETAVKEVPKVAEEVVETPKAEKAAKSPKAEKAAPEAKEEKKAAPKKAAAKKTAPKAKKEVKPKAKEEDSKAAE